MYPKFYIPIVWLFSHVVLPVFVIVFGFIFLVIATLLHEFVTTYVRLVFPT